MGGDGGCGVLLLWGDLDFRCLGIGLSGVSLCLGSRWFLFGLMVVGMSSLCHDDLDHGVIVRVGFVF